MVELTYQEFKDCVQAAEPRFAQQWLNQSQNTAVSAPPSPPVFLNRKRLYQFAEALVKDISVVKSSAAVSVVTTEDDYLYA